MDMISKLPNEVLSHIFSFLPFKSVVMTSISSKRWEYAWTFAPCLDLTYNYRKFGSATPEVDSKRKLARFKDFIDRVLFCHGGSSIQKCALHSSRNYPCPSLYAWICAVVACNVQELYTSCFFCKGFELPLNFFKCKTLVVLKLSGPFLLDLPFHVCFRRLKTLSLKYVVFGDDLSMQRIFSSCPILEDLNIEREGWDGVLIASISVPSLKRLSIRLRGRLEIIRGFEYKIVIDASCLESLTLHDNVYKEVSVKADSLVSAGIYGRSASKVLRQLSHVKDLSLCEKSLENLNAASDSIPPVFHNLTSLWLEIKDNLRHNPVSKLLKSSPNLESLFFSRVIEGYGCHDHSSPWNTPESPPDCLLNLKQVEFDHFLGTTFELSLVRYILQHALVLEKMIIHLRSFFSSETSFTPEMRKVSDEILLYQRGSSTCEIKFEERKWAFRESTPFEYFSLYSALCIYFSLPETWIHWISAPFFDVICS